MTKPKPYHREPKTVVPTWERIDTNPPYVTSRMKVVNGWIIRTELVSQQGKTSGFTTDYVPDHNHVWGIGDPDSFSVRGEIDNE
jgi:hypothetical protein